MTDSERGASRVNKEQGSRDNSECKTRQNQSFFDGDDDRPEGRINPAITVISSAALPWCSSLYFYVHVL